MEIKKYKSKKELELALCAEIVAICEKAIKKYGSAHLLLSGGSTPLELYSLLGQQNLDYSKIKIGLVDERYVDSSSEFNNQKNIEKALNEKSKIDINVIGMTSNMNDLSKNMDICLEQYLPFMERIDFSLLGMGEDGHTASIFPGDLASTELLIQNKAGISYTNSPSFPNKRISCNKAMLMSSENISLMLIGSKKMEILSSAAEKKLPIASFTASHPNINVYFSEK